MSLPYKPERDAVRPAALRKYPNGKIPAYELALCGIRTLLLAPAAARSMRAMVLAAARDGVRLSATGTYRSYERQRDLFFDRYTTVPLPGRRTEVFEGKRYWLKIGKAGAAVPGTSNHGWALAVDLAELDRNNAIVSLRKPTLDWLAANGPKFGWWNTVTSENWHWCYCLGDNPAPAAVLAVEGSQTAPPAPLPGQPNAALPTLRRGVNGDAVKTAQRLLNRHGAKLTIDGQFGPVTERAVRAFQTARKLVVDGVIGPQTWSALQA